MRTALILTGMLLSLAAEPQEIYRWVDKDGVVHYADQPGSPNAERVEIANSNQYEATATDLGSYSSRSQSSQAPLPYSSLTITEPAPDQVFFGADAVITGSVELAGELQSDHTLVFFLDGNRVAADGESVQFSNLDRGMHFLRAAILDQNGALLMQSPQVTFHVREPSIKSPQSPQAPKPPPKPAPKPATPKAPGA